MTDTENEVKKMTDTVPSSKMIAQADFEAQINDRKIVINKGDDLSKGDFPDWFITNLKTEKVLKG